MATLYISEYKSLANIATLHITAVPGGSLVEQSVVIGVSHQESAAFSPQTSIVMVNCDNACSLQFGTTPVAVNTAHRLAANETRFYVVQPGDKVSVITNT